MQTRGLQPFHNSITKMNESQKQNRKILPPPVDQCEKNIADSWQEVFNATNSMDGESNDMVTPIARKRTRNTDSQSVGSSTTIRANNLHQQKSYTAINDKYSSDAKNINLFIRKVKVTFNVCRIIHEKGDDGRRRKARITRRKLVYLLPYNEILFLQNRHAIQRLQKGLLGKEALTKGTTANRHHWRDQITNRDIHLILENEY